MTKILGAILAGLLALQTGLPSLGLEQPWINLASVGVGVLIASLSFYLGRPNVVPNS